eukprot:TRINITY_DN2470_c0_g1_i7.p1 TRINITY_DN2470_c0_g1~~TRINITY_DN2470_c0_g1_i7.p1  ORF type:complete len:142 (+),score=27.57 TRINITY_DN2470_c0_g1_i7:169-594(+)
MRDLAEKFPNIFTFEDIEKAWKANGEDFAKTLNWLQEERKSILDKKKENVYKSYKVTSVGSLSQDATRVSISILLKREAIDSDKDLWNWLQENARRNKGEEVRKKVLPKPWHLYKLIPSDIMAEVRGNFAKPSPDDEVKIK